MKDKEVKLFLIQDGRRYDSSVAKCFPMTHVTPPG